MLGVLLAMGLTACNGGGKSSQPAGSSENSQQSSQQGDSQQSSQQGGSSQSQGGGESSQQGGDSSSAHEHEFGEWGPGKTATYTEFGSEERSCACGEKEERDTNTLPFNIDETSEVMMLNSGNKKVYQYTYNNGAAKVAAVPMKEISGGFKTEAVSGEKEKWTIGADANQSAADTYKLSNSGTGMALLFKVNVKTAINNAFISIGAKYSNNNPRYFKNHGDGGQNGDNPDNDAYRYYTKVNEGEFTPIAYNNLMSSVFGDGKSVCYMPLGKFNLKAGENDIYVRQSNLGYRVTLEGYLYVDLGAAGEIDGTVPSHSHTPATTWSSDDAEHWHECTGTDCDEPGIKLDKAAHTFGEPVVVPATQDAEGSKTYTCSVCGKQVVEKIGKLAFQQYLGNDFKAGLSNSATEKTGTPVGGGDEFTIWKCSGKYTVTYNSASAQKVVLRMFLSNKYANVSKAGVWWQGSTQKMTVKLGEEAIPAPVTQQQEKYFSGYGCNQESTAADGSDTLAVPVWIELVELDLAAGDNTIEVTFNGGGYTSWWGGAELAKA